MGDITQLKDVSNADEDEWFSVQGQITYLEPSEDIHEKMEQKGYISDGTSELEFVDWSNAPEFEIGDVYQFNSVVTNKYKGTVSISLTSSTEFEKVQDDNLIDEKPREQIIREIEQKGPTNKPYVDTQKYRVSVDNLMQDSLKLDKPLWDIECNLQDGTPFWKQYSWSELLPPFTGMGTHTLSLYGINNNNNELVIGKTGSIGGVTGSVGLQSRECLNSVKKLNKLADNQQGSNEIRYENDILWMHLADCTNCGSEFEIEKLIGVNPYNPSEDYLSYYDWWNETERHNIDVPECPDCEKHELEPPLTPNKWYFIQKIPLDNSSYIDDVEQKLSDALNFDAKIRFTKNKILSLIADDIVENLCQEIQDAMVDKKVKSTGDKGLRGITRRYIRIIFDRSLTEDELVEIADCAIEKDEGISRIKKDTIENMVIDFTFHGNKSMNRNYIIG